ncbi:MAG: glutamate--tRNA ligase family protein [Bryobacteraceae bacterium]
MVRVRFAPSPTGYLHIGSARTFGAVVEAQLGGTTTRRVKAGLLINGVRAALTAQTVGPGAFTGFAVLGRERVIARLRSL